MGCKNKVNVNYYNVIRESIIQTNGWSPVLANIQHFDGFVMQLVDWAGGEGDKPLLNIGWYLGSAGYVEDIESATIFGEQGIQGEQGEQGEKGEQGEQGIQGEKGDGFLTDEESEGVSKSNRAFDFADEYSSAIEQYTTNDTPSTYIPNNYIGGYSFPIGKKKPFDTVEVFLKRRVSSSGPLSEVEVRIFKNNADGELLQKKRVTLNRLFDEFESIRVKLDSPVDYGDELWMQFLTYDEVYLKIVTPAQIFTAANGYSQSRSISVDQMGNYPDPLDTTDFPSTRGYHDYVVGFNNSNELVAKESLQKIIAKELKIVTERKTVSLNKDYLIGRTRASDGVYESYVSHHRSTYLLDVSKGDVLINKGNQSSNQSLAFATYDLNKVFVRGVGTRQGGGSLTIEEGEVYARMGASNVEDGENDLFYINKNVIKESALPIPPNFERHIAETWNAVGHSIWWQDGKAYSGTTEIAIGIQTNIRQRISFKGYNNYGYSGAQLRTIVETHSTGWNTDAKIWTLDTITNDFVLGARLGEPDDFLNKTGADNFYGALRDLHDIITDKNPEYIMICATPLQRDKDGATSWSSNSRGHTLKDYTDALLWVADRLSWRVVDQFKNSGINMHNISEFTRDGLHPNDKGYARYAGLWLNEFMKL